MRFRPKTQRLRLALGAALFSGTLLALVFASVVFAYQRVQYNGVLRRLGLTLEASKTDLRENAEKPEFEDLLEANPDLTIAAFRPDGTLIKKTGSLKVAPRLGRGRAQFGSESSMFEGVRLDNGGTLVIAILMRTRDNNVRTLATVLAILYLPLVAAVGLTTWLASRSTFRPLADLARQAEQLSTTDLSRRIEVGGADEYTDLAGRLNRFLDLLQASVQRQERFVADAAHELRTPLTVLRGQIETALLRERPADEYRQTLKVALAEAERLSRLVDGLLLSAAATVTAAPTIDIAEAADQAQARWLDRFQAGGVDLAVRAQPVSASIQPEECDSIFDNMLSNALKHSGSGSTCRIEVRPDGEEALLVVDDEGSGVPAEVRDSLFERFTRADSGRNRAVGGFGIGLAVVKRIVETRGGSVVLAPSPKGARFEVRLPGRA